MKFCDVCQNMMYVRLEDDNSINSYCKNCGFTDVPTAAQQERIFNVTRPDTDDRASYKQYLTPDIRHDKTLPRTRRLACPNPKCSGAGATAGGTDVIYIKYDDINLKFRYHCCACSTFWTADSRVLDVVPALDGDERGSGDEGLEPELGVGDAGSDGQVA